MDVNSVLVSLKIQSEDDMPKLLTFLHETNIQFSVENPSTFQQILYKALKNKKVNTNALRNPAIESQIIGIEDTLVQEVIGDTSTIKETTDSMSILYKPTEHFKEFCGSEWLNANGLISANTALTFLEHNIKSRGIRMVNRVIYTTEWLRAVLQDTREAICYDELHGLVHTLLKK
jgi:hypothetical protein